MISIEDALTLILDGLRALPEEMVALSDTLGRYLAEDIVAAWDLPTYDNSAMDGYAVRSRDLEGASGSTPVSLRLVGRVFAGDDPDCKVGRGEAVRIMTGARVPAGADAVVRQEAVDADGDTVGVRIEVPTGRNIRQRGEDAVRGRPVLWEGSRVDAHRIAVLAAFGHAEVPVVRKPRVSILAGGDELRSVEDASPDVVVDSNSPMLAAMCKEAGAEPRCFGIAEDTAEGLEKKIVEALEGADVLLTVGGASVGERDLVRGVLAKLGMEEVFWKVALKPGKPVGFGRLDGKLIFMLPGNPGAAAITFDELMRPALIALQGGGELKRPRLHGRLKGPVKKQPGLSYLLRGKATMGNDGVEIEVLSRQGSGQITPPLACNAVAHLPRGAGSFEAGDEVEICLTGALPERSRPPLLSFVGTSNSGKTTVLCRLIERLSSDLRVGAIKSAHTFTMDREGKDTQRMRASGARAVGVASPTERACIVATEHPTRLAEMASTLPEELDIIVAEGFKRDRFTPKVEVHRKGNPFLFRGREIVNIVAIVTDEDDVPGELPRFRPEELDALERFVRDFIGQGEPPPKMEC